MKETITSARGEKVSMVTAVPLATVPMRRLLLRRNPHVFLPKIAGPTLEPGLPVDAEQQYCG